LFKSIKWLLLISGILIVIIGIATLFTTLDNLATLAVFIGILMLISGISEIISFCNRQKAYRSDWMLASGILTTHFAVWVLYESRMEALIAILPFVLAVWVILSGIMRIIGSISIKSEGMNLWRWILGFSMLSVILGFLLLFSSILPALILSCLIGLTLVSYGLNNIIIFFRLKRIGIHIQSHIDKLHEVDLEGH